MKENRKKHILSNAAANYFLDEYGDYNIFSKLCKKGLLQRVVTKTFTSEGREGNPGKRVDFAEEGIVQAMGLPNKGLYAFPFEKCDVDTTVSFVSKTVEEAREMTEYINEMSSKNKYINKIEFNMGCPNVSGCPSSSKGEDPIIETVSEISNLPVYAKIEYFSNRDQAILFANYFENIGVVGVVTINSPWGYSGDLLKNDYAGISGPAIKRMGLGMTKLISDNSKLKVIGVGGIYSAKDAEDYFLVGASEVQLCSFFLKRVNRLPGNDFENPTNQLEHLLREFREELETKHF